MDTSFRRVPARRQLEEVSQKLNNLQRLLGSGQAQYDLSLASDNATEPIGVAVHSAEPLSSRPDIQPDREVQQQSLPTSTKLEVSTAQRDSPLSIRFLQLDEDTPSASWTLGGVTVTYDVAKALFIHFDKHKWRHVPILQPCKSLQGLFAASDLLFWTILLQSASNHGLYGSYYSELLPHHRGLLSASLLGVSQLCLTAISTEHHLLIC